MSVTGKASAKYPDLLANQLIASRWARITSMLRNMFDADLCGITQQIDKDLRICACSTTGKYPFEPGDILRREQDVPCFRVYQEKKRVLILPRKDACSGDDGTQYTVEYIGAPIFLSRNLLFGSVFLMGARSTEPLTRMERIFHDFSKLIEDDISLYLKQ